MQRIFTSFYVVGGGGGGGETCSLISMELRVLRRIFGPETEEVTGGWRKLHNEKLHILFTDCY